MVPQASLTNAAPMRAEREQFVHALEDGVPDTFLTELLLRHFQQKGEIELFQIGLDTGLDRVRVEALVGQMRSSRLIEVPRRGVVEGDLTYALTELGEHQARLAFEKCHYVGMAPVTLGQYTAMVKAQSARAHAVTQGPLSEALGDLVIDQDLLPSLGSALNSGKAIYFHGPSGSGKTYLAEHLVKTLRGTILVPHAIYVDGEIIQVFDSRVHHVVAPTADKPRSLSRDISIDARWVRVERPVVVAGGELTLSMLDLEFDTLSRLYVAPPQVKANNGIFVVDDLGRQRVSARDLLNRWIVPLDRRVDYLGLHTGATLQVPFDVSVIFLSNLAPEELTDPAFSRRLGYKIYIGAVSRDSYRNVIRQACLRQGIAYDEACADFMMDDLHPRHAQPFLACIPHDVISKIADRARYLSDAPVMTKASLTWAWELYFGMNRKPTQLTDQKPVFQGTHP